MLRSIAFVTAIALAVPLPAAAGAFVDRLAAYASPTLGAPVAVENASMAWGRSTVTFSGSVVPVLAGEERIGLLLAGTGAFAITLEQGPFYRGNLTALDEQIGVKPGADGTVRETFTTALLLAAELPEALIAGEPGPDATHDAALARHLARFSGDAVPGIDHIAALLHGNHQPADAVLLSFDGGSRDGLYSLDPLLERTETYAVWKKWTTGRVFAYPLPVVTQPFEDDIRSHPQHAFLQTRIDLELESRDNVNVSEVTTTDFVAGVDGLGVLPLELLNGLSKSNDPWDKRSQPLRVTRVTDGDGAALEFSHRYDELLVRLPRPLARGEIATVVVALEGELLRSPYGDNYVVLGNMSYYPSAGVLRTHATFSSIVKVKAPWRPISCGITEKRWQEDGLECLRSSESRPIAFPFVIVGDFHPFTADGPFELTINTYAAANERGAKKLHQNGLAVLDFYSAGMEPFPYHELEVVEIPYYRHFFWQSPAGIVEITSEGLNPFGGASDDLDTWLRRQASLGQNSRYAHEIAHQWFGNLLGWERDSDNWISESFAEYLSYMFMAEGARDRRKAKAQLDGWVNDAKECSDAASIYGAPALQGATVSRGCYTRLLYGKGPLVLHALRQEIGDERFKKMLFFLTTQAAKKNIKAVTEDIVLFVNALTGADYHDWFSRYVYGLEVPAITK